MDYAIKEVKKEMEAKGIEGHCSFTMEDMPKDFWGVKGKIISPDGTTLLSAGYFAKDHYIAVNAVKEYLISALEIFEDDIKEYFTKENN